MGIAPLSARDALTDKIVRVLAGQHPRDVRCSSDTIRVVFDEEGRFLGLVDVARISRYPGRIFADLLPRRPPPPVAADAPLRALAARFQAGGGPLAVLDEAGRFLGVVTHTSLLDVLLSWNEGARSQAERLLAHNRRLMQRLFSAQEAERLRLARELHDEMGQYCTAIVANLQMILNLNDGRDEQIQARCHTILELCDHVHGAIQSMLQRLRPGLLDEVGLCYALKDLVANWSRSHGEVDCHLVLEGDLEGLGEAMNIALYRIIQEALTNVARHARAREVCVALRQGSPDAMIPGALFPAQRRFSAVVMLDVRDDGQGFVDNSTEDAEKRGLGLTGIRERVLSLGGEVVIEGRPGQGVSIQAVLPVTARQEESGT